MQPIFPQRSSCQQKQSPQGSLGQVDSEAEAEKVIESLSMMQPENRYEIVQVDENLTSTRITQVYQRL